MYETLELLAITTILGITMALTAFAEELPSAAPLAFASPAPWAILAHPTANHSPVAVCGYRGDLCLIDQPDSCCSGYCTGGRCQ